MPIAYPAILQQRSSGAIQRWVATDAILYALGLGLPADPLDPAQLAYVDERRLKVVPTFAAILARDVGVPAARLGFDMRRLVHGAHAIEWHRPVGPAGAVTGEGSVVGAWDKGDKGAIVIAETRLRDTADGAPVATIRITFFARGDGHFGGPTEGAPAVPDLPARPADRTIHAPTRADQHLLYRLSGDFNPLHLDPAIARAAGFDRPILHGMCSFGMVGHALLTACADGDAARLASLSARFSAPVFPGETLAIDVWEDGPTLSFRACVAERGVIALTGGRATLRDR